jgi:hypothetical protein
VKRRIPSRGEDGREDVFVSSNEEYGELWIMQNEFLGDGDEPSDQHFVSIAEDQIDALIAAIQEVRKDILTKVDP